MRGLVNSSVFHLVASSYLDETRKSPCSTICFADAASRPSFRSFLSSSVPRPSGKGGSLGSRASHSALGAVYAVKSIFVDYLCDLFS